MITQALPATDTRSTATATARTVPLFQVYSNAARALENLAAVLTPRADGSVYLGEGALCEELECKLAKVLGFPRVLLVNSGTSALRLALHLAGARPGTEVISTAQTCLATNTAVLETGATIVWADVDPETGNISPDDVLRKITPRTVVVMAVDWAGRVCDFQRLREYTRGISLIEDAAHAFGAAAPARGDYVCWSHQAIKHFSTGDGGSIACPGSALTERARLLRWFGLDRSRGESMRCYQQVSEAGFKMQSNNIAAAIGLANLEGVLDRVDRCRENARRYHAELSRVPYLRVPPPDDQASWWIYTIKVSQPIVFERFMQDRHVAVGQVHARNDVNKCFDRAVKGPMPGLDEFSAHQTNLPCGWHVSEDELGQVIEAVRQWSSLPDARW